MTPQTRAYLQAVAALANIRSIQPDGLPTTKTQRPLELAEAAVEEARAALLVEQKPLYFVPARDISLTLGNRADLKLAPTIAIGGEKWNPVAVALDIGDEQLEPGTLFGEFTFDDAGTRPEIKVNVRPFARQDPVQTNRNMATISAALALPTGSAFQQAVYCIAYLEQQFRRACSARAMNMVRRSDGSGGNYTQRDFDPAPGYAYMALQQARRELQSTLPEADDALANTYRRWVLADLECDRLETGTRLETPTVTADEVTEAHRVRSEALTAFVAAAA